MSAPSREKGEPLGERERRRSRLLPPISLHEVHVCPTVVEDEDGELVYVVDGC